jgi:hypothetical protein
MYLECVRCTVRQVFGVTENVAALDIHTAKPTFGSQATVCDRTRVIKTIEAFFTIVLPCIVRVSVIVS